MLRLASLPRRWSCPRDASLLHSPCPRPGSSELRATCYCPVSILESLEFLTHLRTWHETEWTTMDNSTKPDKEYDVVIVGAGPEGCMASLCFTTYGFSVVHIDLRPETTQAGHVDDLQARILEVIRNIGAVPSVEGVAGLAESLFGRGIKLVAVHDDTREPRALRSSRAESSVPPFGTQPRRRSSRGRRRRSPVLTLSTLSTGQSLLRPT